VSRPTLLLAKLVPYYVVSLLQMAILFGIGVAAFGMEVRGSPVALVVLTMAVSFCAVALGLFIASFGGSQKQVGSVGSITLLVMGLVGGAMVPRLIMPAGVKAIGLATPHAWALDGYYQVLMRDGAGLGDISRSVIVVLAFGVGFAAVGAWRFEFER
jgi:ABC-2 type transport system permease protein